MPKIHLRIDGLMLMAAGLALYAHFDYPWWMFIVFLFAPDIFMAGYLFSPRLGARIYNIGHTLIWPVSLALIGLFTSGGLWFAAALIWTCHIGLDHLIGYGFKYDDAFGHTHFSEI